MNLKRPLVALAFAGAVLSSPALAANIILNNVDAPGVGFNDPTPAAPVGGNAGTTVGQQRLIAYQRALQLWGRTLRSPVTIVVRGSFARLDCARGVLASAGALQIFSDFPGATLPRHWYGAALANSLAGQDLAPGPLDVPGPNDEFNDDIQANFNGDVGKADCLPGPGWYYGLDNTPVIPGQIDFLDTFMHEVAHGLGFQNFVNEQTGAMPDGQPDVYMSNTLDLDSGLQWNTLTPAQIAASAVKNWRVVWSGPFVGAAAPTVLGPYESFRLTGTLNQELEYGTASFGAPITSTNFSGPIVVGRDAAGGTLGCGVITAPVAGAIAYVDRGTCGFVVKAKNAQNAGAIGVIIGNNAPGGSAIGLGGSDPTVVIPAIGIGTADGAAIKANSPGVSVQYTVDPSRLAGTTDGYVRLYAPRTVALGSSGSHFDISAAPNLLMEPSINGDLRSATNLDLTPALMRDVGWQLETLKVGACDSGVPGTLADGQMLHVNVEQCRATSANRGGFVSCMAKVTEAALAKRLITTSQKDAVMSCAARG
jgi:hypothetical protein